MTRFHFIVGAASTTGRRAVNADCWAATSRVAALADGAGSLGQWASREAVDVAVRASANDLPAVFASANAAVRSLGPEALTTLIVARLVDEPQTAVPSSTTNTPAPPPIPANQTVNFSDAPTVVVPTESSKLAPHEVGDDRHDEQLATRPVADESQAAPPDDGHADNAGGAVVEIGHSGDSLCLFLPAGGRDPEWLTAAHNDAAQLAREGLLDPSEVASHPLSRRLSKAVGRASMPDLTTVTLHPGDQIVLMSDGVTGALSVEQIAALASSISPQSAAERLIEEAVLRGSTDNCTALVVRVDRFSPDGGDDFDEDLA